MCDHIVGYNKERCLVELNNQTIMLVVNMVIGDGLDISIDSDIVAYDDYGYICIE